MKRRVLRLSVTVLATLSLTGCHFLLMIPCVVGSCGWGVVSIPPRVDPFTRALEHDFMLDHVETMFTSIVQAQYGALDQSWPERPQCDRIAATGCRYSIPVKVYWVEQRIKLRMQEFRGCALLDIAVAPGESGLPEARRMSYQPMQCPASVSASGSDSRLDVTVGQ